MGCVMIPEAEDNRDLDLEGISRHVENIAHELQIRLQAALAQAENLYLDLQSKSDTSCQELSKSARDLVNTILSLDLVVKNLGQISEDYWFRKEPMVPLLHACRDFYEAEAKAKGVTINVVTEPENDQPVLEISREHLQQALFNIVHNAVKYSFRGTPEHSRWISIRGYRGERRYTITTENYGVGILEDEYARIFEDGYRGRLTRGEHRTGTGRGLYVAKKVIEDHGGEIEVSSEKVNSAYLTLFTIHLPYSQASDERMHE